MENSIIILIRGLPGAGKSTFAKILSENGKYPVFSVDDYFTDKVTGEYKFIFSENHIAYKFCIDNLRNELQKKTAKIFIANTFTMDWEMKPYFELAKEFSSQIHICTLENYHESKNIHEIPQNQILKMADNYKVKLF